MNAALPELDPPDYCEQTAGLLGLKLTAERLPAVAANLAQLHAIAVPLLAFAVAEDEEIAPVFVP